MFSAIVNFFKTGPDAPPLQAPKEQIKKLKECIGPEIQVHGSGNLIQTLFKHNLVDELWLKIFPVTLGKGKRLFAEGTNAAGFELFESETSPSGVIITN